MFISLLNTEIRRKLKWFSACVRSKPKPQILILKYVTKPKFAFWFYKSPALSEQEMLKSWFFMIYTRWQIIAALETEQKYGDVPI